MGCPLDESAMGKDGPVLDPHYSAISQQQFMDRVMLDVAKKKKKN